SRPAAAFLTLLLKQKIGPMSPDTHQLSCRISSSLWNALQAECVRTGDSLSHVIERALASELDVAHHSLFQVSTSAALVEGVFQGCLRVSDLKLHGDFGLGTYDELDGELVMLDGLCFQVGAGGIARAADDESLVPFAAITRFSADRQHHLEAASDYQDLLRQLDALRPSQNVFVGIRVDGLFADMSLRAACKARPGENLVAATGHQSEFRAPRMAGTLVGFWSPAYARATHVPGYHLHFINADRTFGGHVLGLKSGPVSVGLHVETDIHLAIPETRQFLEATLRADPSASLDIAER
ncbi:MAG: acetolactate decarboxylase, partial [Planctomycetaceae bacterium]